jgi:hypothetical protein
MRKNRCITSEKNAAIAVLGNGPSVVTKDGMRFVGFFE